MESIIQAENLTRKFIAKGGSEEKIAVNNISFEIRKGTIYGLLGPNGAGKSTTIKMLTTTLLPSSGKLNILGYDIYREEKQIRPKIGLLYGGEAGLYWQLNGRDNLRFFGSLFKIDKDTLEERINYWLDRVGLGEAKNILVKKYSKGMKQRLHIARTLLHDPEILFMDEPTLGLDPQGTIDLREIIMEQKNKGKTILLTTHDMEEAEELCDIISFIMDGKIIMQGTIEELQNSFQENYTYEIELKYSPPSIVNDLKEIDLKLDKVYTLKNGNTVIEFDIPKSSYGESILKDTISVLAPYSICNLNCKKMDLRSMYLSIIKNNKELSQHNKSSA
jgi:ABC-2 type transport system ATP-binding protein